MRHQRSRARSQKKLRRFFLLAGVPLLSMCLTFIVLSVFASPSPHVTPTAAVVTVSAPKQVAVAPAPITGPPVRLVISSIGVDALVNAVGLTDAGAMDIGENPDQVAWYQFGAIPGQEGNAVIAGHYGWKDGHGSVFNALHTIQAGDTITVYDAKGITTTFVVRETRLYDPTADASEVFVANDGKAHLNLITCEGTWVNEKDSYSNRLVVFADLQQ